MALIEMFIEGEPLYSGAFNSIPDQVSGRFLNSLLTLRPVEAIIHYQSGARRILIFSDGKMSERVINSNHEKDQV